MQSRMTQEMHDTRINHSVLRQSTNDTAIVILLDGAGGSVSRPELTR